MGREAKAASRSPSAVLITDANVAEHYLEPVTESLRAAGLAAKAVTLEVKLPAGPARLQTWLTNTKTGKTRGAYDLTIERV